MLLDLDEIDLLPQRLRLFSRNRFNAVSFHDSDHGDGSDVPLRRQIDAQLRAAGIEAAAGPIRLLCMPRIFGYGFNPLSVYFCYRNDGPLVAVLYEVHNTFGERHSYLIPVEPGAGTVFEQCCNKNFYVSPFMDMDMSYAFRVVAPGERISVAIDTSNNDGRVLTAALIGTRRLLTDAGLLRVLAAYPFATLKVIAAIHWHAVRMWLKGFRLRPRPAPPGNPVTIVAAEG
jgi:DUF1365 family protein